jgi:hypothetical protein
MGKLHPAPIAVLFAFLGLGFFHCVDAKAEAGSTAAPVRWFSVENSRPAVFEPLSAVLNVQPWLPCALATSERLRVTQANVSFALPTKTFLFFHAKEFFIRTGTSPPAHFA